VWSCSARDLITRLYGEFPSSRCRIGVGTAPPDIERQRRQSAPRRLTASRPATISVAGGNAVADRLRGLVERVQQSIDNANSTSKQLYFQAAQSTADYGNALVSK
jgi:hypothetical protein